MSGKATALLGIAGAAALGIYFKWQWPRRASDAPQPKRRRQRVEIDDDAAADIIKRARPALERARESYAW
jgi:Arc/MetJ family transcription regulator